MTAVRLSPAASLLRNSKLFSLPPTLALPPQEASSTTIASSDTATTPYPVRAAIETPHVSLHRGDWGLKRSLPLKTTTKTGTPVIRVQRGLDTPEHTVDFESAADHVLTLQKWQNLHMAVQYPTPTNSGFDDSKKHGVFLYTHDNTTNISNGSWTGVWPSMSPKDRALHVPKEAKEEGIEFMRSKIGEAELRGIEPPVIHERLAPAIQPVKRWRYDGPWLAGMTGMQFDEFLKKQVRKRRKKFRERVELQWLADKVAAARARALHAGSLGKLRDSKKLPLVAEGATEMPETEQDVLAEHNILSEDEKEAAYQKYLRALRRRPQIFGPLIAEFLDLPDGPKPPSESVGRGAIWEYGRDTVASENYRNTGPPRTHPSAGLAYARSRKYSLNDANYGPQNEPTPVVGRVLKTMRYNSALSAHVGVAGFVSPTMHRGGSGGSSQFDEYVSKPGGQKILVVPSVAMVNVEGRLDLHVRDASSTHVLENDEAVRQEARKAPDTSKFGTQAPILTDSRTNYKKAEPVPSTSELARMRQRSNASEDEDPNKVLAELDRMGARNE